MIFYVLCGPIRPSISHSLLLAPHYIHIHVHTHTYTYIYTYIYTHIHIYILYNVFVCNLYVRMHNMFVCKYMYVSTFERMCTCVYRKAMMSALKLQHCCIFLMMRIPSIQRCATRTISASLYPCVCILTTALLHATSHVDLGLETSAASKSS
jgi:hypothetical protein